MKILVVIGKKAAAYLIVIGSVFFIACCGKTAIACYHSSYALFNKWFKVFKIVILCGKKIVMRMGVNKARSHTFIFAVNHISVLGFDVGGNFDYFFIFNKNITVVGFVTFSVID